MPHPSRFPRLALAMLVLAGVGCYKSVPVQGGAPSVSREVVLELTERGALELAPQLGAQLVSVTGRIGDFANDRYEISITQTNARGGVETLWKGERATIRSDQVERIFERRVDKKRTWMVVALTVAGAIIAGEAFGINTGLDGLIGGGGHGTKQ